jgi:hypothetical protein
MCLLQAQVIASAKPHDLSHARASYERLMRKVLDVNTIGLLLQRRMTFIRHAHHMWN